MNTVLVCEECLKGEWCWYDDLGEKYVDIEDKIDEYDLYELGGNG